MRKFHTLLPALALALSVMGAAQAQYAPHSVPDTVKPRHVAKPAPSDESQLESHRRYRDQAGHQVHAPSNAKDQSTVPNGARAHCRDGSYSFSHSRRGTGSHHGGVAAWL